MPTIGWFEILIIVTIAILVVGPKDFPKMLKKIGSWIGSTKRYLTNVQREVTELSFIEGLTHQEISDKLGIPLGTVKSRLRLAFEKLKTMIRSL